MWTQYDRAQQLSSSVKSCVSTRYCMHTSPNLDVAHWTLWSVMCCHMPHCKKKSLRKSLVAHVCSPLKICLQMTQPCFCVVLLQNLAHLPGGTLSAWRRSVLMFCSYCWRKQHTPTPPQSHPNKETHFVISSKQVRWDWFIVIEPAYADLSQSCWFLSLHYWCQIWKSCVDQL